MVGPVGLSEIFWSVRFEVWHGTVVMTAQPAIVRAFQGKSRPGLLSVSLHMHTQDLFARAKKGSSGARRRGLLIPFVDIVLAFGRVWYPLIEGGAGSVAMDYSIGQHMLLVACMLSCIRIDAVVPRYECFKLHGLVAWWRTRHHLCLRGGGRDTIR